MSSCDCKIKVGRNSFPTSIQEHNNTSQEHIRFACAEESRKTQRCVLFTSFHECNCQYMCLIALCKLWCQWINAITLRNKFDKNSYLNWRIKKTKRCVLFTSFYEQNCQYRCLIAPYRLWCQQSDVLRMRNKLDKNSDPIHVTNTYKLNEPDSIKEDRNWLNVFLYIPL